MKGTFTFKSSNINTGPVTLNGRVLHLNHPDGRLVKAGDLIPGVEYEVDTDTGVLKEPPICPSK